jgi:site-specific DNA recombinase
MNKVRCAIYTRKSSEEGLEQDFNSLHAQREACAAYILSQASEGWSLLPEEYDDGGLSGGTLERPALQRLLADMEAGRIDIVVVYKVDRLTRSLLDFSRLVETMDKAEVSFVSVTQSFNTTTSMGRLTLNMLLSFAQFEREVTAERIRDKIAASKAKGMWMGGIPPLGYEPDGRTLKIVEEHAEVVQSLFRQYLELGNVRLLVERLTFEDARVPLRTLRTGRRIGGGKFSRGQVYAILSNPAYLGKVRHKEAIFDGTHPAIIGRDVWDEVQARLRDNAQGAQRTASQQSTSVLAGRVFDEDGQPLVATHACKGKVRYRYYVSRSLQHQTTAGPHTIRVSADQLEKGVAAELAKQLEEPLQLFAAAGLEATPQQMNTIAAECSEAAVFVRQRSASLLRKLISRVQVASEQIIVAVDRAALAAYLGVSSKAGSSPQWAFNIDAGLRRSGKVVRLVRTDGSPGGPVEPQQHLVKLMQLARRWWKEMQINGLSATELAVRHQVDKTYVSRVVRLAFLSPKITQRILAGEQPPTLNARRLLGLRSIPPSWAEQETLLLSY